MKKSYLFLASAIVLAFIIIALTIWSTSSRVSAPDSVLDNGIARPSFPYAQAIPVQKSFEGDIHRITGILTLPDPCYDINHEVIVMESFPEQVEITLTTPRRDEICATVITDKEFQVEFQASENAVISATLNGESVELSMGE